MSEHQGDSLSQRENPPNPRELKTATDCEAWLISHIAHHAGMDPHEIDSRKPFTYFGLSSTDAVILSGDMEEWLGRPLSVTLAWDYPTIEILAQHLAEVAILPANAGIDLNPPTQEDLDLMLAEVEQLSEDEAQKALKLKNRSGQESA